MIGRSNLHEGYVNRRRAENDHIWKNLEKNLYFSVKNKACITPLILWVSVCTLCGAFGIALCGFIGAWLWCLSNNQALDNDINIIKQRVAYMNIYIENHQKKEAAKNA